MDGLLCGQVLVGLLAGATARDVIAGYLHAALASQARRVACALKVDVLLQTWFVAQMMGRMMGWVAS